MDRHTLFHVGFGEIKNPDVHYGRKNADFGQGFYLTFDQAFSERWARERKGYQTYLNTYELDFDSLEIKRFARDAEWFDYIYGNRNGGEDILKERDVIIGPIANDTIFDVLGITTSGFLSREQSLSLLMIGPEYQQISIKSERAARQLRWVSSRILAPDEIAGFREVVEREEKEYQALFSQTLERLLE